MRVLPTTLLLALFYGCAASGAKEAEGPAAGEHATLIVLHKSDASAALVDAATGETRALVPTGEAPHEVAVHGTTAVVCNYGAEDAGSSLTVIDVAEGRARRTIDLGDHRRPHGIQFEDGGRHVIVTTEEDRSILRVDVVRGRVADVMETDQDVSHMLVLTPDRRRAFVANIGSGSVTAVDLASGEVLRQIPTGRGAEGIDVTPDGREVWVTNRGEDTLTIIDARSLEVEASLACGEFPIRLKVTPDGAHALVSNARSGDVAVFEVPGRREVARIPMELDAAEPPQTEGRLFGSSFGSSPVPVGILIEPDGRRAWIANTNADIVTEIDLATWRVAGRLPTGREPDGLGWSSHAPPAGN